jgi:ligand-binding SRPBCC domain-containing protein
MEVFAFFADPRNLERITPPWLHFEITTPGSIVMRPGCVIDYTLRLHGMPIRWRSEISAWEPPNRFVDLQVRGPYRLWRHEHIFIEKDGGTTVADRVDYAVPGGRIVHRIFVAKELEKIFEFRRLSLEAILGRDRGRQV